MDFEGYAMSASGAKFTDRHLKLYFGHVLSHYQHIMKATQSASEVYEQLFQSTQYALEDDTSGGLYTLNKDEKLKVYNALDSIFKTLPVYTSAPGSFQIKPWTKRASYNKRYFISTNFVNYAFDETQDWFNLFQLMLKQSDASTMRDASPISPRMKSFLIRSALMIVPGVNLLYSLYFMFSLAVDSLERMWFNEGFLKAGLLVVSAVSLSLLTLMISASTGLFALIWFTFLLLFNVGLAGGLTMAFGSTALWGAGIGCIIADSIYNAISSWAYSDSLDPDDPLRFCLTRSEEANLLDQGIEPIKVKFAIIALRAEIGKIQNGEAPIPSFIMRQFGQGKQIQSLLNDVRELRAGNKTQVKVGELIFNCLSPDRVAAQPCIDDFSQTELFY